MPQLIGGPGRETAVLPWGRAVGYSKKEQSVIGENCLLGEKVTIKQCSIGLSCEVGGKTKLNNCILFDGAKIGDG